MVEIQINVDAEANTPAPARERSVFAIGWVKFRPAQSTGSGSAGQEDMQVLGVMVVQDKTPPTKDGGNF